MVIINKKELPMKIALSTVEGRLEAEMDPRFGRAAYFLIVDPENLQFEAIPNPNVNARGGAGIQSAQLVLEKGAEVVITGSCGPNAFRVLQAAGISIYEGGHGTAKQMIQNWKDNKLPQTQQPHHIPMEGKRQIYQSRAEQNKSTASNERKADEKAQHKAEIALIKEEIGNMEQRLTELNRKLEEMKKDI